MRAKIEFTFRAFQVEVEICGPMRPWGSHDNWGKHKRSVRVPAVKAEEQRWQHMRDWVAKHINNEPKAQS